MIPRQGQQGANLPDQLVQRDRFDHVTRCTALIGQGHRLLRVIVRQYDERDIGVVSTGLREEAYTVFSRVIVFEADE